MARERVAGGGPEGPRGRGGAGTALDAASASAARLTSGWLPGGAPGIDELLAEARSGLARLRPETAFAVLTGGAALVDIRPLEQRIAEGEGPGAIIIARNVLEWRPEPPRPTPLSPLPPARRPRPLLRLRCHPRTP